MIPGLATIKCERHHLETARPISEKTERILKLIDEFMSTKNPTEIITKEKMYTVVIHTI